MHRAKCLPLAALFFAAFSLLTAPSAHAWGCKGHQVVALIAENHLTPGARSIALQILATAPADPALASHCRPIGDPFAGASTWADDVRQLRPETAPWHFIDLPRGARKSDIAKYCPPSTGCVITALADQLRILRDSSVSPRARADALRFVIHFVGDIHQPLHASTNNDLGGNCVPVIFFGRAPAESGSESGAFIPNLHEVWDVEILRRFSANQSPSDLARQLDQQFTSRIPAWQSRPANFTDWAWESHQLAETIVYGRLPHPVPIETPRSVTACSEMTSPSTSGSRQGLQGPGPQPRARSAAPRATQNSGVSTPEVDETLAGDYQRAAAPVVQEQLAKAAARLASLLNSLWPDSGAND